MEEQHKARIGWAREVARKCYRKLRLFPPVDIEKVLKDSYQFEIVNIEVNSNISAMVDLDDHYIGINSNHHIHRQRFTLAHELGHCCLGHKNRKFTEYAIPSGQERSSLETEANEFAAEFLMPLFELKKVHKTMSIDDMCKYFNVSREALFRQLMKYKLI